MFKVLCKALVTLSGPLFGWIIYLFEGPFWLYVVAIALILSGLLSFSFSSGPDPTGYEKRADDGRGYGTGFDFSGSGDC